MNKNQSYNPENNLWIFDQARTVPDNRLRSFNISSKNGRERNLTDISPMWRIETLTQIFGPCGKGWAISDVKFWSEQLDGKVFTFCNLKLKVKDPQTGEWWEPIPGHGGNSMTKQSDEAYKCAYTDALGVACKLLGFAADIYYGGDTTKYDTLSTNYVPWGMNARPAAIQQMPQSMPVQTPSQMQMPMNIAMPPVNLPELHPGTPEYNKVITEMLSARNISPAQIYAKLTNNYMISNDVWTDLCKITNINPNFIH